MHAEEGSGSRGIGVRYGHTTAHVMLTSIECVSSQVFLAFSDFLLNLMKKQKLTIILTVIIPPVH